MAVQTLQSPVSDGYCQFNSGRGDMLVLGGVVRRARVAGQATAGVPVTARQVAKHSVLVWR